MRLVSFKSGQLEIIVPKKSADVARFLVHGDESEIKVKEGSTLDQGRIALYEDGFVVFFPGVPEEYFWSQAEKQAVIFVCEDTAKATMAIKFLLDNAEIDDLG